MSKLNRLRVTRADLNRITIACDTCVINGVAQLTPQIVEDLHRMMEYQNCDVLVFDLYGTESNV